jgi:hypothetical protein
VRKPKAGSPKAGAGHPVPSTFEPSAGSYAPLISTFRSYLPAARPTSPNVKAWSRGAAISAARQRRELREEAQVRTLGELPLALRTEALRHTVVVTIIRDCPARYRMDDDNWQAAAKPVRDGVADVFAQRDDHPCFVWRYDQRVCKEYGVEIRIEVIT